MAEMMPAILRILTTQVYELSPEELRAWRESQPGEYKAGRGETRKGWSQRRAAEWIGVSERTWQAWEGDPSKPKSYPAPARAVRRIVEYSQSLDAKLDAMLR